MRIRDLMEDVADFYDPTDDEYNKADIQYTRKPRLTLRMINRLKKMRSVKELEMSKKRELLSTMYGKGPEE